MKLTKRKIRFLAVLLLSALTLTSCSTSAEVSSADRENEAEWAADIHELGYPIVTSSITSYDDSVYFAVSSTDSHSGYYRWTLGDAEPEKLALTGKASEYYISNVAIHPDSDGNIFIVLGNLYLCKYDSEGNELFCKKLDITPTLNVFQSAVDKKSSLYVSYEDVGITRTTNMIYIFDSDGETSAELPTNGLFVTDDFDGNVFCTTEDYPTDISSLSRNGKIGKAVVSNCKPLRNLTAYTDDRFIASVESSLYVYDSTDGSVSALFNWADLGIAENRVVTCCGLSDGTIVAMLGEDGAFSRTGESIAFISPQDTSDKTTLTLGMMYAEPSLMLQVAEFNSKSEDYKIKVKEYYDVQTDTTINRSGYQDALTKFHLDIVSGNGPDILCLDYDSLENYAQKDMFEDLSPYLEKSSLTLPGNVLNAYTYDSALVAIPPMLRLSTIVAPSAALDGKTSWTLSEMMDFIAKNNNVLNGVTILNAKEEYILKYCLKLNLSHFVDFENYTCDFENDDFYSLLDFCHTYGTETKYANAAILTNIRNNDAVIYDVSISTPVDNLLIAQFLETEDLTYIGFPTDSGSGTLIEEMYGSLAIFSGSEHKDIAWEFIKLALESVSDYDYTNLATGFPTAIETFEQYAENETEEVRFYNEGKPVYSWSYVFPREGKTAIYGHPPSDEEFAPIEELLRTARSAEDYDSTILDIILENAEEYFSGEKSAEEAAKQIQSRVKIYLNERK